MRKVFAAAFLGFALAVLVLSPVSGKSAPFVFEARSTYPRAPMQITLKVDAAELGNETEKYFLFVQMTRAEVPQQSYYGFFSHDDAEKLYSNLRVALGH